MKDSADQKPNTGGSREAIGSGDRKRREISGPGAADFLTAPGGVDTPESDPSKGTRGARGDEGLLTDGDAEGLAPDLDEPARNTERRLEEGGRGKEEEKNSE